MVSSMILLYSFHALMVSVGGDSVGDTPPHVCKAGPETCTDAGPSQVASLLQVQKAHAHSYHLVDVGECGGFCEMMKDSYSRAELCEAYRCGACGWCSAALAATTPAPPQPFSTPDDKTYYAPESSKAIRYDNTKSYVVFSVLASSDAHISLVEASQDTGTTFYEFVLGGWKNQKSAIRRSRQGPTKMMKNTPGLLSTSCEREFWVCVDSNNGKVSAGKGHVVGDDELIQWIDPQPINPMYFEVSTGWGSKGQWLFPAYSEKRKNFHANEVFSTPDDKEYYAPPHCHNLFHSDGTTFLLFSVKAHNDAHIGLFSTSGRLVFYEFVISGWRNSRSVIRKSSQGANRARVETDLMLSPDMFEDFWVSVHCHSGRVAAGIGHNISTGTFMEWTDPDVMTVEYFEVMTGWGSSGEWLFEQPL